MTDFEGDPFDEPEMLTQEHFWIYADNLESFFAYLTTDPGSQFIILTEYMLFKLALGDSKIGDIKEIFQMMLYRYVDWQEYVKNRKGKRDEY